MPQVMEAKAPAALHAGDACDVEHLLQRLAQRARRVAPSGAVRKERRLRRAGVESLAHGVLTRLEMGRQVWRHGHDARLAELRVMDPQDAFGEVDVGLRQPQELTTSKA